MSDRIEQIVEANLENISSLCRGCGVEKLFLFGSAAENRTTEQSDMDFGVVFGKSGSDKSKLHEGLCSMFQKSIHLIDVMTTVNPYLRQVILSGKRIF